MSVAADKKIISSLVFFDGDEKFTVGREEFTGKNLWLDKLIFLKLLVTH